MHLALSRTAPLFAPGATSPLAGRAGPLARAAGWVRQEWRVRRSLRELSGYDDAMLRDIGLQRGELETVVRFGRDEYQPVSCESAPREPANRLPSSLTEWR